MKCLNEIGIAVSTYEEDTPVLTYIFWGIDIDEAVGYARSHMETDSFFRSSFIGTMEWKGNTLYLHDIVQVLGDSRGISVSDIRDDLYSMARSI